MADEELFDPDFLARLRTLFFKLRRRRLLTKKGSQQTRAVGATREFKDYRHYTSRDDFRAIDWRLFARLEKLFIRIFEEIQEYHVHILIDRSLSMAEPHPRKRVTELRIAVALAYLALMNQHRVSVLSFADELRTELQPLRGQGHIHSVLQHLAALECGGDSDLERSLRRFRPSRDRRGIAFILSDLLGPNPDDAAETLRRATTWPVETHVIHLLDPRELRPDVDGEVQLYDVESGETRRLSLTKRELDRYETRFQRYLEDLAQSCLTRQVDYVTWTTDLAFETMFLGVLSRGSALAQ